MGVYAFRSGPAYRAANANEQMTAALDMPMSGFATLGDQFKGGVLDSLGLGTVIREMSLPSRVNNNPNIRYETPSAREERLKRYDENAFSEASYKASPYFREGVKWDNGMTEDRAAALAEAYDAKRVREYFATKRPVTSFIGNLAGQALDPINYLPVAGPAVKAGNVGRFGLVAGTAVTGAIDASINTALASAVTFDARKSMGDDITWQTTVSDIAMSALIGAAFGSIGGLVESRRAGKLAAAQREAASRLATLRNTQDARIALNSAVDSLARGEDLSLNANAADAAQAIAERSNPIWSPDTFASIDRPGLFSTTSVGRFMDHRSLAVQDFESMVRETALNANPDLAARYRQAEAKFADAQEAVAAIEEPLAARTQTDALSLVDAEAGQRVTAIDQELAGSISAARRQALQSERDLITENIDPAVIAKAENDYRIGPTKKAKAARKSLATARQEFAKVRAEVDGASQRVVAENRVRYQASVDRSVAPPDKAPDGLDTATVRAGTPDNFKAAAEQYRVNPEDGSFVEQAEVDQMRQEGRVTPEDEMLMNEAQKTFDDGLAFGEALKAAAACLI